MARAGSSEGANAMPPSLVVVVMLKHHNKQPQQQSSLISHNISRCSSETITATNHLPSLLQVCIILSAARVMVFVPSCH